MTTGSELIEFKGWALFVLARLRSWRGPLVDYLAPAQDNHLLIRHCKACGFLASTCLLQSNDSRLRLDLQSSHCLGIRPEENVQADGNPCRRTRTTENKRPAYANVASPSFSFLANPVVIRPRKRDRHVERIANVFSKIH